LRTLGVDLRGRRYDTLDFSDQLIDASRNVGILESLAISTEDGAHTLAQTLCGPRNSGLRGILLHDLFPLGHVLGHPRGTRAPR